MLHSYYTIARAGRRTPEAVVAYRKGRLHCFSTKQKRGSREEEAEEGTEERKQRRGSGGEEAVEEGKEWDRRKPYNLHTDGGE